MVLGYSLIIQGLLSGWLCHQRVMSGMLPINAVFIDVCYFV